MASIKGRDTQPEKVVRRFVRSMGHHLRICVRKLPGNPDIVLPEEKKIIFIHGCFWHGHKGCRRASRPRTNAQFWNRKIESNMKRDVKVKRLLKSLGWKVLVIWQCQMRKSPTLQKRLERFLARMKGQLAA